MGCHPSKAVPRRQQVSGQEQLQADDAQPFGQEQLQVEVERARKGLLDLSQECNGLGAEGGRLEGELKRLEREPSLLKIMFELLKEVLIERLEEALKQWEEELERRRLGEELAPSPPMPPPGPPRPPPRPRPPSFGCDADYRYGLRGLSLSRIPCLLGWGGARYLCSSTGTIMDLDQSGPDCGCCCCV